MSDLVDFLRARLDDDERIAREAAQGDHPRIDPPHAAHIARHDPARVLREVAAKRVILDSYRRLSRDIAWWEESDPRAPELDALNVAKGYELLVLEALAATYADHPDYRDEWRP